jgi:hypothetical protein
LLIKRKRPASQRAFFLRIERHHLGGDQRAIMLMVADVDAVTVICGAVVKKSAVVVCIA